MEGIYEDNTVGLNKIDKTLQAKATNLSRRLLRARFDGRYFPSLARTDLSHSKVRFRDDGAIFLFWRIDM